MSDLERTLEEERRIINAATDNWRATHHQGGLEDSEVSYFRGGVEFSLADCSECGGTADFSEPDAEFIAHARTALPIRNAQVAKVLHECGEMEWWAQNCFDVGKDAEGKQWIRAAKAIRRAIEEAGHV